MRSRISPVAGRHLSDKRRGQRVRSGLGRIWEALQLQRERTRWSCEGWTPLARHIWCNADRTTSMKTQKVFCMHTYTEGGAGKRSTHLSIRWRMGSWIGAGARVRWGMERITWTASMTGGVPEGSGVTLDGRSAILITCTWPRWR